MKRYGRINYTITIGITGAEEHVGVTHLVIMLANYLASKERRKVAVVDLSKQNSLMILQQIYNGSWSKTLNDGRTEKMFCVHKVDYYSQVTQRDIANILHLGYEYIIVDFGKIETDGYSYEMLRCHKRILVGSCCEWQQKSFSDTIKKCSMSGDIGDWCYSSFLGISEVRRKLEKIFHIQIHKIPYEEDPFRLSRTHFEPLRNLLQEEKKCL